jgi:hypothetical protein
MAASSNKQQRSPYHDQPLGPGQIRLLSVIPTTQPSLRHVYPWLPRKRSLHLVTKRVALEDKPQFAAVSYVWGTAPAYIPIPCNKGSLLLTSRAYNMLVHHSAYVNLYWIDAICIDQENTDEKAVQITLMRKIYAQANDVLLWMGPANPLTEAFMLDFPRVFELSRRWILKHRIIRGANWRGDEWPGDDDLFWDGYYYILSHEWFRRLWTFQEAVLSRKALIVCGYQEIDMDDFMLFHNFGITEAEGYAPYNLRIASCVTNDLSLVSHGIDTCSVIRWLRVRFPEYLKLESGLPGVEIPKLLFGLRQSHVKEPVDRVWAIAGLLNEKLQDQLAPVVDYSDRGREEYWKTYIRFAKTVFTCMQSHDLLNLPPWDGRPNVHLPTWCSDFSKQLACLFFTDCKWNRREQYGNWTSDGLLRAEPNEVTIAKRNAILTHQRKFISISEDDKLLITRGFVVDTVVHVVQNVHLIGQTENFPNNTWPRLGTRDPIQNAFFTCYTQALALARQVVYGSTDPTLPIPPQYLMCLMLDCGIAEVAEPAYRAAWTVLTTGNSQHHESYESDMYTSVRGIMDRLVQLIGHSFFATEGGRFGIANPGCKPGDKVCVFHGGEPLYMLRWSGAEEGSGYAEFCGAAFIPHLMEQYQRDEARLGEDEMFHIK